MIAIDRGHLIHKADQNPELSLYPSQINGAEIILMNTTKPPLDDVRVRQALALANDQRLHVKMVYGNTVPLVHHPFGDLYDCPNVEYPEHAPEKAKQLLDDLFEKQRIETDPVKREALLCQLAGKINRDVPIHMVYEKIPAVY